MSVSIKVFGVKGAQNYIKNKSNNVIVQEAIGLNNATLFLEGEVKSSIAGQRAENTSVDTGRFLNSVTSKSTKDNGVVFTNISYSKFLEYGTSKFTARRHFTNSASRNKVKIKDIINKSISKI